MLMNVLKQHKLLQFSFVILSGIFYLANSSNPQNGRTGAPFDGHCNSCHGGNNPLGFNGTVELSGMPSLITPNITYPLTVTMTSSAGNPTRGGFQLVVVDNNNTNAGDLTAPIGSGTGTETTTREYVEHRDLKNFSGNGSSISWTFNWKAPATAAGNTIKVYFIGNFCNGSGDANDFMVTNNETYQLDQLALPEVSISSTTNVACFGGNTGSATVMASGGSGAYTYAWSNGQSAATAVNLTAGTYTVTVSSTGAGTASAVATITQPLAPLSITTNVSNNINCNTPTATITAQATGGTAPYTYSWPGGSVNVFASGTYVVTVTDNNNCTKTATAVVTSNTTQPLAIAVGSLQSCTTQSATVSGLGSSTGAGYTYQWSPLTGGTIVSGGNSLAATVAGIGTYQLLVTNTNNGCTATATATVTPAPGPNLTATGAMLTCNQPVGTVSASSTTPNVGYSWSGPSFSASTPSATVTEAGTYIVTATAQSTGCTTSASVQVINNQTPPNLTTTTGTITCSNSSITITANSTTPSVTYSWTGPAFSSTLSNPTVTQTGSYTVVATNPSNGCTATSNVVVNNDLVLPIVNALGSVLTCSNPAVQITASTTTLNPVFQWSGPGIVSGATSAVATINLPGLYTITVTNPVSGCTNTDTWQAIQNITPPVAIASTTDILNCNNTQVLLSGIGSTVASTINYVWQGAQVVSGGNTLSPIVSEPGIYTLVVTNVSNGCSASASTTVTERTPVTATITSTTEPLCAGSADGSATVLGGGGAGGYTYTWNTNSVTAMNTGLTTGIYTVTVTDADGCSATATTTIAQPTPIVLHTTTTQETGANQNDGSAIAFATGGTGSYAYIWSNNQTTALINQLAPGNYTVTVTDANNCTSTQNAFINPFDCMVQSNILSTPLTCAGDFTGTVQAFMTGSVLPVVYQWSTGANTSSLTNLAAGTYGVTMTDATGCVVSDSVIVQEPLPLTATVIVNHVNCPNESTGSAQIFVTGGTGQPYSFVYPNPGALLLPAGSYNVTITDQDNCMGVASFTVEVKDTIKPVITCPASVAKCDNGNFTNFVPPVFYDNCIAQPLVPELTSGLPNGSYFPVGTTLQVFKVTDQAGNTATCSFTVTTYPLPDVQLNSVVNDSNGTGMGSINITPIGGTEPFMFNWKKDGVFFADTEDLTNLTAAKYGLLMIDANGCSVQLAPISVLGMVGTHQTFAAAGIRMSPNPADTYIRVESGTITLTEIALYALDGTLVSQLRSPNSNIQEIDIALLPAGMYLITATDQSGNMYASPLVIN